MGATSILDGLRREPNRFLLILQLVERSMVKFAIGRYFATLFIGGILEQEDHPDRIELRERFGVEGDELVKLHTLDA